MGLANKKLYQNLNMLLLVSTLLGCSSSDKNDSTALPQQQQPPTLDCQVTPTDPECIGSISGTVTATNNTAVDIDVNDPNAPTDAANNDSFADPQLITNPISVHGYVTQLPTNDPDDLGDVFADSADEVDIFQVDLQANQVVSLLVADHVDGSNTVDLDLDLYDVDESPVDCTTDANRLEHIQVLADGRYYIAVRAIAGASKYVLTVGNVVPVGSQPGNCLSFTSNDVLVQFKDSAQAQQNRREMLTTAAEAVTETGAIQRVHLNTDNYLNAASNARTMIASHNPLASTLNRDDSSGIAAQLARRNPAALARWQTIEAVRRLKRRDDIAFAEPNFIRKPFAIPSDTYFNLQWHYNELNLPQAWDITQGSDTVIVGVVDTGVWLAHNDLQGKLVGGYDFISSTSNSLDGDGIDANPDDPGDQYYDTESSWHGTHVAGTIAANTDNKRGVAGVGWNTRVMPLRALGAEGGTTFDIVRAMRYAAGIHQSGVPDNPTPVDIINLSLGGPDGSSSEQAAISEIIDLGVIVIAAAGNENTSANSYPAAYADVIGVSATGPLGVRAPYSNFGSYVDIAAPGGDFRTDVDGDGYSDGIASTVVDESLGKTSGYAFFEGTSMAAPHVAGVVALMKAVYPKLDTAALDNLIKAGSITHDIGAVGPDSYFGYGLIDALLAVQAAQELATLDGGGAQLSTIRVNPSRLDFASAVSNTTFTLSQSGGDSPDAVTSVTDDSAWLSVTENSVDAEGMGTYNVTVNRSGLPNGIHLAQVNINLDSSRTYTIKVSAQVGDGSNVVGDSGYIYILLVDPDATVDGTVQEVALSPSNGKYNYTFNNVAAGEYYIWAGSDVDNNYLICEDGESCGRYPTMSEPRIINISGENFTNLDFTSSIISAVSSQASFVSDADSNNSAQSKLPRRLPIGAQTQQRTPVPLSAQD